MTFPQQNPFPQQNNGQFPQQNLPQINFPDPYQGQKYYPHSFGSPTMQDLLLKSVYPDQNGGPFDRSDWLKLGLGTLGNLWNNRNRGDNDPNKAPGPFDIIN